MGLRCTCTGIGGGDASFCFVHDALSIVVAASAIASAITSSAIATVIICYVAIFVVNVCGATAASATSKSLLCHIHSF